MGIFDAIKKNVFNKQPVTTDPAAEVETEPDWAFYERHIGGSSPQGEGGTLIHELGHSLGSGEDDGSPNDLQGTGEQPQESPGTMTVTGNYSLNTGDLDLEQQEEAAEPPMEDLALNYSKIPPQPEDASSPGDAAAEGSGDGAADGGGSSGSAVNYIFQTRPGDTEEEPGLTAPDDEPQEAGFPEVEIHLTTSTEDAGEAPDDLTDDDRATVFDKSKGKVAAQWKTEEGVASEEDQGLTTPEAEDDAEEAVGGKVFSKVEIHGTATYGDAGEQTYLAVELENVQDGADPEALQKVQPPEEGSEQEVARWSFENDWPTKVSGPQVNSEVDEASTLVRTEDNSTGEMVRMGTDAAPEELDASEIDSDLEALDDS